MPAYSAVIESRRSARAFESSTGGARVVGGGAQAEPVTGGNVLADYPASDSAWTATAATNPAAQSFVVYAIYATSP